MTIEQEILLNQFGQGIYNNYKIINQFELFDIDTKRNILRDMEHFIIQSNTTFEDIGQAINESKLKSTFTPCVILNKGLNSKNFDKIINLPESELTKAFRLFIHLFKISYSRRYLFEKGNSNKWWYWDLSNQKNIDKIIDGDF